MTEAREGKCPFGFDAPAGSDYAHVKITRAMSRDKLPQMAEAPIEARSDGLLTGRCLCGAASFRVDKPLDKVFANHDETSRRWSGGIALTVMVRATSMTFHGWGRIVHFASSERERRCFCRTCGTNMFVRHVQPAAMDGMLSLCAGTFDHFDGLSLAAETYIDRKPGYYTLEGSHRVMTEAEVEDMFRPRAEAG